MTETETSRSAILVTGASGKTGRRVAAGLRSRGVPVRAASRAGEIPFDWEEPSSWGPALEGASAAYVSYYPDLAAPGGAEAVGAFAAQAAGKGMRRLVLVSGRGEEGAEQGERVVQEAIPESTIVRCSWFNQNFSESYFLEPVLDGEVALPAGDVLEPFVDADDIAEVAVAALTEDGHTGHLYELTGPRSLTFAEAVEEIGRASGRDLSYVPVSIDDYMSALADAEVPEDVSGLIRYLFTEVLDGRNARPADGVQRALGRKPRDFADYASETAATGVWNV